MRNTKMVFSVFMVIVVGLCVFQVAWYFIYSTMPHWDMKRIESSYNALPSDVLLKKLDSFIIFDPYRDIAVGILRDRKDKNVVPYLINQLRSWNKEKRYSAMLELSEIGDVRAVEPLMKIVEDQRIDYSYGESLPTPDNIRALEALAKMKHGPVYGYAIDLANSERFRANGVLMLEYLEDPKAIPLLKKIAQNDPEDYIRHNAQMAIDKIEAAQLQE